MPDEKRVAVMGIVVRDRNQAARVNDVLSRHGDAIIGRQGVPISERGVSVITVIIDADQATIGAVSGALGNIPGVTLRTSTLI